MPLGGFCGTCRPTPTWNQRGLLQKVKPKDSPPSSGRHVAFITRASKTISWHQIQPHPAPNPVSWHQIQPHPAPGLTTLGTRSNGTQSPKSPSLRIKFNHTYHRIQPHPVSNPAMLGTEFTLTRHQIQPHGTKGNHTWYQCRPRCTRKSTTPADRPSHAQPHIQAHQASNPTSRHQIPPQDTKSHLTTPNPTS